jgi:hypothetical protein
MPGVGRTWQTQIDEKKKILKKVIWIKKRQRILDLDVTWTETGKKLAAIRMKSYLKELKMLFSMANSLI